jgi:alpha-glucosidase
VGGFAEAPTAELYTRWLQSGILYPFFRTHTAFGTPDQEPWSYGPQWETYNRRAIELRYELLPHIYNAMHETSVSGLPAMRPLMLDYPDDPATYGMDDEYLFGSDLLLAPVLREGAMTRDFYLPRGTWVDVWTGRSYEGGRGHSIAITPGSIPLFARGGSFIFRQPVVQHTGEMPGQPLIVEVYASDRGESSFYEDDGQSFEYEKGQRVIRTFAQERTGTRVQVTASAANGSWRPQERMLRFVIQVTTPPNRVTVNGTTLTRASSPTATGWSLDDRGFVVVSLQDRFEQTTILVE